MILRSIFLLLIYMSANANSLLLDYRINGIEKIEKQMDLELTQEAYWSEYIKNIDTTFGYIESYSSVLSCDKNKSTLVLYKQDENKTFSLEKNYNAFTGEVEGDKVREGDLKTPLGIYRLTKKISKLDSFYGPLAFVTSYPNTYDRYRGKNGSGIWIHGLPIEQERDEFTKGCIAINNINIIELDKKIDIKKTLLIINQSQSTQITTKEKLSSILAQLYLWRYTWLYNDIEGYLDFYADNFVRNDGMKIKEFRNYKKRIFAKNEKKEIIFNDINIIPYPNTTDIFQITFKEYYTSSSYQFTGDKTLMIKVDDNHKIKIFTEK